MAELRETHEHIGVHHRDYAVEPALRQRLLYVEHKRFGLSEAGGLNDDDFRLDALDDFVHRRLEFTEQRAANATAAELGDAHILSLNDLRVDCDLAELVHNNCHLRRLRRENVPDQRGFAAAQRTGYESDRSAQSHDWIVISNRHSVIGVPS